MTSASAPAKINAYLHLRGRRGDGYHLLDSLVLFLTLGDRIEVAPADGMSLSVTGPFADAVPGGEENLVLKAVQQLRRHGRVAQGAAITLHKNIPTGAGLGGGSADAAAALRLLAALWGLAPAKEALHGMAAEIGSDVPACLDAAACYMGGVGEVLAPVTEKLPRLEMVLAYPGAPLATADVYRAYQGGFAVSDARLNRAQGMNAAQFAEILGMRRNDLEKTALRLMPAIGEALDALRGADGCLLARMTGSGSACFGIFSSRAHAAAAAERIAAARPGWWVQQAQTL